ncbi:hypothetical protein ACHAXS_006481 [Conticribra weissflogii]
MPVMTTEATYANDMAAPPPNCQQLSPHQSDQLPQSPSEPLPSPHKPRKIHPLPPSVIALIAAGEVIQRPVNIVKELLENSLDADATVIDIFSSRGGMDSISVSDDGFGIRPGDLPLAATRFATSKLGDVEDLKSIRTFGFRGEALASASMVGRVTITSRVRPWKKREKSESEIGRDKVCQTKERREEEDEDDIPASNCAYKMHYKDGQPVHDLNGNNSQNNGNSQSTSNNNNFAPKPKPSAGKEGTIVQVQDLFYNIPSRRRAMEGRKREAEEYDRILTVAQKYAVHCARRGVGFLCRGGGGGGGGYGKGGRRGGKSGGIGVGMGNHTDLNTQSITSVKKLQEQRKKARIALDKHTADDGNHGNGNSAEPSTTTVDETKFELDQIAATKDVIAHIFGSCVARELLPLNSGEGDVNAVSLAALMALNGKLTSTYATSGSNCLMEKESESINNNGDEIATEEESYNASNRTLLEEMMTGDSYADKREQSTTAQSGKSSSTDKNTNNHSNAENSALSTKTNKVTSKFSFAYKATGLITNPSYSIPKNIPPSSSFLLFINGRLVESPSLRRSIESIYADTLPKGGRPFVYLSLELPGPHVDVNVHPTKREVAFLHEERLCDALSRDVKGVVGSAEVSRVFVTAATGVMLERMEGKERERLGVGKNENNFAVGLSNSQSNSGECVIKNASIKETDSRESYTGFAQFIEENESTTMVSDTSTSKTTTQTDLPLEHDPVTLQTAEEVEQVAAETNTKCTTPIKLALETPKKRSAENENQCPSSAKKPYDPSRLVRTSRAAPVGALEPFLVKKHSFSQNSAELISQDSDSDRNTHECGPERKTRHKEGCEFAKKSIGEVDMTVPGAFTSAICRCQVRNADKLPVIANNNDKEILNTPVKEEGAIIRPKKITPTRCDYESISKLRKEIFAQNHQGFNETLRGSTFVGVVSRNRSLIQCGIDLLMINHYILAKELFYQLALMKFNGMPMAILGNGGVDVMAVIGQMLQFEEDLNSSHPKKTTSKVSKTNIDLARQATTCLAEKAPMLEEYFSIKFEKQRVQTMQEKSIKRLFLSGLPILLDGHYPQPHALPIFLLRLATEVNWKEEQPCFEGICRELASFYAEAPSGRTYATSSSAIEQDDSNNNRKRNVELVDEKAKRYIQHILFPAISFLLVPSKQNISDGAMLKLANLTSLYKVFERC